MYQVTVNTQRGKLITTLLNERAKREFVAAAIAEYGIEHVQWSHHGLRAYAKAQTAMDALLDFGAPLQ